MKVLALHGYLQNGSKMYSLMKKLLTGKLKPTVLECPTGPFSLSDTQFGWWNLPSREHLHIKHEYEHVDVAINIIKALYEIHGSFDIVIGFSQGAVLVTILASLGLLKNVKHIVCMSGSDIQDIQWVPNVKINMPVICVIGEADQLCPQEDSQLLANYYESHTLVTHKYGHSIPTNGETRRKLEALLN